MNTPDRSPLFELAASLARSQQDAYRLMHHVPAAPPTPAIGTVVGLWWYGRPRTATVRAVARSRIVVGFHRFAWSNEETLRAVKYVVPTPVTVARHSPSFAYPLTEPQLNMKESSV